MTNSTKTFLSTVLLLTVFSFAVKAQTNISGGIYSNTTWTKANSPYIVIDTVVVFPGVTLTVEAGVTVKFADSMRLEIRQSTIIAIGTISDSITFTSSSISPLPGIWGGLLLNQPLAEKFNYCNFRYAAQSINHAGSITSDTMLLKNSVFNNNINGLTANYGEIDSCLFYKNNYGISSASSYSILYCNFYNNAVGVLVANSTLNYCISNSNQIGIYCADGVHVQNCTIDSNTNIGITFNNCCGSALSSEIKYNAIGYKSNGGTTLSQCIIENNVTGIELALYGTDVIYCNKICNNTTYDLYYDVNYGSNANYANNYWCSTDSATIAFHIYDGYDNVNLGLVSFVPFDTIGCYLTGCDIHLSTNVTNATCDTCHNGQATVNISNGHPNYTYTWQTSPIQTTQTATGLASGTYTVCVSDGNGCTACTTVFIDSSNCTGFAITANATNATCLACTDGSAWVTVSNGTAPYTYTWYTFPTQNTDTAVNVLHGRYAVCVTDLYGCVACDSVTIGTGACSAHFDLYPDTLALHQYTAVNMASGAGTLSYDWNWGDGSADDTVAYPSHEYATAGFYTICLSITDTAGCTNTYCNSFYLMRTTNTMIHVNVVPSIPTGINEPAGHNSVYIYPNPASSKLTLILPANYSKGRCRVFNLLGELIYSSTIDKQEANIDVSDMASGIYILEVSFGDSIIRQKFIRE